MVKTFIDAILKCKLVYQVKPEQLTEFLQVKKNEGYCIVGVEQTANSQSLQDYQFPEKTLLLLGYDSFTWSFWSHIHKHDSQRSCKLT